MITQNQIVRNEQESDEKVQCWICPECKRPNNMNETVVKNNGYCTNSITDFYNCKFNI